MEANIQELSLFQLDTELDEVVEEIQGLACPVEELPKELTERFEQFCQAFGEKADRIARFLRIMEAREQFCRQEGNRLMARARTAEAKADRTKAMVMYFLRARGLTKLEGMAFELRMQRNSQDSVRITDQASVPVEYCRIGLSLNGQLWENILAALPDELARPLKSCVESSTPDSSAIKSAKLRNEHVPGAEVHRGSHLRVA